MRNHYKSIQAKISNIKLIFIALILIILSPAAFAQNQGIIKLSPQHFFANTLKVEFENSLSPHSSYTVSPAITAFDKGDEKVIGGGMELGRRFYVLNAEPNSLSGFYANVSVMYNYYNAQYEKKSRTVSTIYPYSDSTITNDYKEKIHQFGGDFVFGYQFNIKEVFFVDMYFGGGMRIGVSSMGKNTDYGYISLDYAYNGIIPKVGIKAGLKIR